jgi:hypothetical protein
MDSGLRRNDGLLRASLGIAPLPNGILPVTLLRVYIPEGRKRPFGAMTQHSERAEYCQVPTRNKQLQ